LTDARRPRRAMTTRPAGPSRLRAWVLAARPRTLTAAAAPVLLGTGLAAARDAHRLGPALAALLGALLIQVGTNLANDYYDHVRGGDTPDRIGPLRVTQAGLIPPGRYGTAPSGCWGRPWWWGSIWPGWGGGPSWWWGSCRWRAPWPTPGDPFLWPTTAWGTCSCSSSSGWWRWGEPIGSRLLGLPPDVLLAGAGMGALSTAILVVNNLRDLETDRRAGKRTLAVRLGRPWTKAEFVALLVAGFAVPLVGVRSVRMASPDAGVASGRGSALEGRSGGHGLSPLVRLHRPRGSHPALLGSHGPGRRALRTSPGSGPGGGLKQLVMSPAASAAVHPPDPPCREFDATGPGLGAALPTAASVSGPEGGGGGGGSGGGGTAGPAVTVVLAAVIVDASAPVGRPWPWHSLPL
jgi:1,4-dihydroxy-2-naphthoate polyprenyltransferase